MSDDPTFLRAVANALWPSLRRNRWQTHTVTRDLSKYNPSGYQAGPRSSTVATAPSMDAVIELHHECYITAVLYAEDWPGKTSHALRLDKMAYMIERTNGSIVDHAAFDAALIGASCRQPFHQQANRHGQLRLRRNATDILITPTVAATLERIAAVTEVLPIAEATIDDFLIGDEDVNLEAVRAALGYERPSDEQRKRNVANNVSFPITRG